MMLGIHDRGYLAVAGVVQGSGLKRPTLSPRALLGWLRTWGHSLEHRTAQGWVRGLEWSLDGQHRRLQLHPLRECLLPEYQLLEVSPDETRADQEPESTSVVEVVSGFDPVYQGEFVALVAPAELHLYYRSAPGWSRADQWWAWAEFQRLPMPPLSAHRYQPLTWSGLVGELLGGPASGPPTGPASPDYSRVYLVGDLVDGPTLYLFAHPTGMYLLLDDYALPLLTVPTVPTAKPYQQPLAPMVLVVVQAGQHLLLANDCYLSGENSLLAEPYENRHQELTDAVYNSQNYLAGAGWELHYQTQSPFDNFERLFEVVREHLHRPLPYSVVGLTFRGDGPVGTSLASRYSHRLTESGDDHNPGTWLLLSPDGHLGGHPPPLTTDQLLGRDFHPFLRYYLTQVVANDSALERLTSSSIFDEPAGPEELPTSGEFLLATVHGSWWLEQLLTVVTAPMVVHLLTLNQRGLTEARYGDYELQQADSHGEQGRWLLNGGLVHPVDPFTEPGPSPSGGSVVIRRWRTNLQAVGPQVVAQFARHWCLLTAHITPPGNGEVPTA